VLAPVAHRQYVFTILRLLRPILARPGAARTPDVTGNLLRSPSRALRSRRKIVLDATRRAGGLFDAGGGGHTGKIIAGKEQAGVFGFTRRNSTEPLRVVQTGLWQPIAPAMRARYERRRATAEQLPHFAVDQCYKLVRMRHVAETLRYRRA